MDALTAFLNRLKKEPRAKKHFLGLLHALIGCRNHHRQRWPGGQSRVELAGPGGKLKKIRWDPDCVGQLGMENSRTAAARPEAIVVSGHFAPEVDSPAAVAIAAQLAEVLRELGYEII